jgi:hypothetical protein
MATTSLTRSPYVAISKIIACRAVPLPRFCRWIAGGRGPCPRGERVALLELVKARRINLAGQSGGNPLVKGQESEEPSQRADVVLQT